MLLTTGTSGPGMCNSGTAEGVPFWLDQDNGVSRMLESSNCFFLLTCGDLQIQPWVYFCC